MDVELLCICESAVSSADSLSLGGILHTVEASATPAWRDLYLVARFRIGRGEDGTQNYRLTIQHECGKMAYTYEGSMTVDINASGTPFAVVSLVLPLRGFQFEYYGIYTAQMESAGHALSTAQLRLQAPPDSDAPTDQSPQ